MLARVHFVGAKIGSCCDLIWCVDAAYRGSDLSRKQAKVEESASLANVLPAAECVAAQQDLDDHAGCRLARLQLLRPGNHLAVLPVDSGSGHSLVYVEDAASADFKPSLSQSIKGASTTISGSASFLSN